MTDPREVLRALGEDPRLAKLADHVSALSLFRTFRVERDEVVHSRLLAMLLDPGQHRGAGVTLRTLLEEVLERDVLDHDLAGRLKEIAHDGWDHVRVRRELFLIDIVVDIPSPRGAVVVGIENKIDAGEQREQVARYQDTLLRAFPGRLPIILFLSPSGREPLTARNGHPVPVVALSYEAVLRAVEEARRHADLGSRDEHVLGEVAAHLKEDIVGDPEVKALVRELWRTHRRALALTMNHRPRLGDIQEHYVGLLTERYGDKISFQCYPERGDPREIKMHFPSWRRAGYPLTFMLYVRSKLGRPRARVLVFKDGYRRHAAALGAWARRVNAASAGPIIDEDFTPVGSSWGWHRVLIEEDHPESAVVDEMPFDDETAAAAAARIFALVERLRPHVEGA